MNTQECMYCHTDDTAKNGVLKYGGQRFRCRNCHKSFTVGGKRGTYDQSYKNSIAVEYCHKHISARDIVEKYGISSATLINWSKVHKKDCKDCG